MSEDEGSMSRIEKAIDELKLTNAKMSTMVRTLSFSDLGGFFAVESNVPGTPIVAQGLALGEVFHIGLAVYPANVVMTLHSHEVWEIVIVTKGTVVARLPMKDDANWRVSANAERVQQTSDFISFHIPATGFFQVDSGIVHECGSGKDGAEVLFVTIPPAKEYVDVGEKRGD